MSDGGEADVPLEPQSVAVFYWRVMEALRSLGVPVAIRTLPNELPDPIPFDRDETHHSYDAACARQHWELLVQAQRVFDRFRAPFVGKCSPVHYFWGGPDLALTRFSGRRAPEHPGGVPNLPDWVVRDAYSHEVSSAGFWAGNDQHPYALFYSYVYPEPPRFAQARVRPREARYSAELREFILPYDAVRQSASPDDMLLEFLQSTYEAAAQLASWPSDLTSKQV